MLTNQGGTQTDPELSTSLFPHPAVLPPPGSPSKVRVLLSGHEDGIDPYLYPFPDTTFNLVIHLHVFSSVHRASYLHSANTCFEPNYLSARLSLMHCQGNLLQMSKELQLMALAFES